MIEWDSHNHMIFTWIRNTSIPSISNLMGIDDAKSAWDMLAKRYSTTHGSMKYQLVVELHQLKQEPGQSINDYYDQLRFIWDQIDLLIQLGHAQKMLSNMLPSEMNFASMNF